MTAIVSPNSSPPMSSNPTSYSIVTTEETGGGDVAAALVNGIDPGYALTKKGRAKRNRSKRDDDDPNDISRHRFAASHIKRAFNLFGYIPTLINHGIKRRARSEIGEPVEGIMSDRDYETFQQIAAHLSGFEADIIRYRDDPLTFRALVRQIQEGADAARSNDVCNIKKDIANMLTEDQIPAFRAIKHGDKSTTKIDRGFLNDITGRFLCPVVYDWDNKEHRDKLRDGYYSVTADTFPRLLYADCRFNPEDMEDGLCRNMALVRVIKYIFTGRSAAFSDTAGGKTTRAGNAELAGMQTMTPNAIAYGACIMRFALSTTASWCKVDIEFDMEKFYWNVVGIFEESEKFSSDLLGWWNLQVFGIGIDSQEKHEKPTPVESSFSTLKHQRAAKRARILLDTGTQNIETRSIVGTASTTAPQNPAPSLGSYEEQQENQPPSVILNSRNGNIV